MVAKLSIYAVVVFVCSTANAGVIATPYNINLIVNLLAFLGPFVVFAGSSMKAGSVANVIATNPTVDIYGNSIFCFYTCQTFYQRLCYFCWPHC